MTRNKQQLWNEAQGAGICRPQRRVAYSPCSVYVTSKFYFARRFRFFTHIMRLKIYLLLNANKKITSAPQTSQAQLEFQLAQARIDLTFSIGIHIYNRKVIGGLFTGLVGPMAPACALS